MTTHDEVLERLTRVETKLDLVLKVFGIGFSASVTGVVGLIVKAIFWR